MPIELVDRPLHAHLHHRRPARAGTACRAFVIFAVSVFGAFAPRPARRDADDPDAPLIAVSPTYLPPAPGDRATSPEVSGSDHDQGEQREERHQVAQPHVDGVAPLERDVDDEGAPVFGAQPGEPAAVRVEGG
ncbi:hypothetical protein TR74_01800, partial [Carbonactinospora thermoautotrophica]